MAFANPIHKLNFFFFLIIATELLCFKCPMGKTNKQANKS